MEQWKPIKDYEGLYEVSNLGRVKNYKEKILSPFDNGNGYLVVTLFKNKKKKNHYIHRLVAFTFLPNPNHLEYVNHLDFNTKNNNVSNLEICTQKTNILHSVNKMKHRKSVTHTNTGEKYIYYRKDRDNYRIVIDKKEYSTSKTLKEAIEKRDEFLNGEKIS